MEKHSDEANDAEQGAIEVLDELERIQQARQDTAREIFEIVERMTNPFNAINEKQYYGFEEALVRIRQSLKSKFLIPPNPVGSADV